MIKYGIDISATGSIVSKDIANIVIETKLEDVYFYNCLCILLIVSFVTIMAVFLYLNNKVEKEYEYKIKEMELNDEFRIGHIENCRYDSGNNKQINYYLALKYKKLLDNGILTKEEFENNKKQLLEFLEI